jgi:tRNA-uridine 2-sulfurtransferase
MMAVSMAKNKSKKTNTLRTKGKPKVFVGLSGGVDSGVSAALLMKDYDVTGVFIKVWSPDFLPCTWREDRLDAMRVCAHLDIPFLTLDLENEYKKEVVDYMIAEYKLGRTPNPDVMCNKEIKFGAFYDFARNNGADFIATGHYVQKVETRNTKHEIRYELKESVDTAKEQSYFLWNIKKEQLPHVLFPIGGFQKSKVRELAKKFKLPNSTKKDSQGLCFIGKVDMKDFLSHFIDEKKGKVLDTKGNVIGEHDGAVFLTIGQRHGFTIKNKGTGSLPHYIVGKDAKKNTITVSTLQKSEEAAVSKDTCTLSQVNWITEPEEGKVYSIRFRYHQEPLSGTITKKGKVWGIDLSKPSAGLSIGQSAVVYDKKIMIGGGVIEA